MTNPLPNWKARQIREASVPLRGKPLRNVKHYVLSLYYKDGGSRFPSSAFADAFVKAIFLKA